MQNNEILVIVIMFITLLVILALLLSLSEEAIYFPAECYEQHKRSLGRYI